MYVVARQQLSNAVPTDALISSAIDGVAMPVAWWQVALLFVALRHHDVALKVFKRAGFGQPWVSLRVLFDACLHRP